MELVVLLALGLAFILIKTFAHRENSDVIGKRDTPVPPRGRVPTPSVRPAPSAPPKGPPRGKWTECTPTPAGARVEMSPRERRACALVEQARRDGGLTLKGSAYVIDGDTIVIDKTHIRLAGIDAPELDQPYGRISKSAMIGLCRGRQVIAEIKPEMSYDRIVAVCKLDDGTDLAEALVRKGLALDWRTFSGGRYRGYEPPDARKKLWKTAKRQGRAGR